MADFLAVAENLSMFSLLGHVGRLITYKLECATEDDQLSKVTVKDNDSGEIFEKETLMTK